MTTPLLRPATEAGEAFVSLAESHAENFAKRADEHDREGTFPHENIEALRESGFTIASAPTERVSSVSPAPGWSTLWSPIL